MGIRWLLLAMGLSGAWLHAQAPSGAASRPADPRQIGTAVASETFLGMVTCAACSGTRVELALYREGGIPGEGSPSAYHMRETHYGALDGDTVVDTNGVWIEQPGPPGEGTVIQLDSGRPQDRQYLQRVPSKGGELVLLDAQLHELPPSLPHTLTRVTGDHQLHMTYLTEADDGRTVEMKPGEVFLVRLPRRIPPGYEWICDRPASIVLLETGGQSATTAASAPPSAPAATPPAAASGQGAARPAKSAVPRPPARPTTPEYQVWQLIAPPPGTLALHFQYRKVGDTAGLPMYLFSLTVVTR
jgi:predicted secreted protein